MTMSQRFGLFLIISGEFALVGILPSKSFSDALFSVIVLLTIIYGIWLFITE